MTTSIKNSKTALVTTSIKYSKTSFNDHFYSLGNFVFEVVTKGGLTSLIEVVTKAGLTVS